MPPKRPRAGAAPASSRAPRAPSAGRGGGAARGSRGRGRGGRARALDEDVRDAAGGAADDDDGFDFDESGAGSGTSRVGAGAGAGGGGAADDVADVAESGDAKRLRLARDYLDRLEADVGAKAGDGDEDEDDDERRGVLRNKAVSQRLADDASLISGTLIRPIAAKIIALGVDEHAAVVFKSPQRVRTRDRARARLMRALSAYPSLKTLPRTHHLHLCCSVPRHLFSTDRRRRDSIHGLKRLHHCAVGNHPAFYWRSCC